MGSINLHNEDDKNPPIAAIANDTHLRNVIGLSFDYKAKRIFFSDIHRGDIQAVSFDGQNFAVIVEGMSDLKQLSQRKKGVSVHFI